MIKIDEQYRRRFGEIIRRRLPEYESLLGEDDSRVLSEGEILAIQLALNDEFLETGIEKGKKEVNDRGALLEKILDDFTKRNSVSYQWPSDRE